MTDQLSSLPECQARDLLDTIRQQLIAADGIAETEFTLIQKLKADGLVANDYSFHPLSLFRVHFRVFNALYRLQTEFAQQDRRLVISPLAIYLAPASLADLSAATQKTPVPPETSGDQALRDFYLDWQNYEAATEEGVVELLSGFWRKMRDKGGRVSASERAAALAELDLHDPVSADAIKQRYRRLAMVHHPDRGGSPERLQRINAAMVVLCR